MATCLAEMQRKNILESLVNDVIIMYRFKIVKKDHSGLIPGWSFFVPYFVFKYRKYFTIQKNIV